ncbi:YajG family lipoprotein [Salinimonas lutimaris]|uniref:adenosine deaminase n=1 Tax=Salinimonas lutimaris TaxID=914153 RepID=UPI0010BFFF63|nr:adenosine deaminase [Salinimonas lutimaris]
MKKVLFAGLSTLWLSGCASIMTSEQQTINVTASNGKKVEVTVDDKTTVTPGTVTVLRDGKEKIVNVSDSACQAAPIEKNIAPAFWGNIIIGGLLGSTTDSSTGKMWNYADNVEIQCSED